MGKLREIKMNVTYNGKTYKGTVRELNKPSPEAIIAFRIKLTEVMNDYYARIEKENMDG